MRIFVVFIAGFSTGLCYTPEGIAGDCRSIYNCPSILAQFQGHITRRTSNYLRSLQCEGGYGEFPHVCCLTYNEYVPPVRPTQTRPQSTPVWPVGGGNRGSAGGNELPVAGTGTCGVTALSHRIFGGDEVQNLDDYPWMAILEYQSRK